MPATAETYDQTYRIADLSELHEHPKNPRQGDVGAIVTSIEANGFYGALEVQKSTGYVLAGNHRLKALRALGRSKVPIIEKDCDDATALRILLADNRTADLATYDESILLALLIEAAEADNLYGTGYDGDDLDQMIKDANNDPVGEPHGNLAARFIAPPFSVLDARQGYWLERKAAWHAWGIFSDDGTRENVLSSGIHRQGLGSGYDTSKGENAWGNATTSIFDPVLAELAYRWFNVPGGRVLDPFAGESTKGLVAGRLGYPYVGIELRQEQVDVNARQAAQLVDKLSALPVWITGDSDNTAELLNGEEMFDLVFTSPPYYDLEVYSESASDGSTLGTYQEFMMWLERILRHCVERLRDNRFVVLKVGEVRNKRGAYHSFVADTINVMRGLGLAYYNEAILVTPVGSLPVRAGPHFATGRKLGKAHQNVLVFWKGDPRAVKKHFGSIEVEVGDDTPEPDA